MPIPLFTNNAATALAVAVTPTDTVFQVVAGTGEQFPSPTGGNYFMMTMVQINNPEVSEIVKCIGRTGDFLTVERGQEGTAPQIFNISDNAQLRITAQSLNLFAQGGSGGGSGAATNQAEFTATQGQTVFTLPFSYIPDDFNLAVFVNGSKQIVDVNYSESSSTTVSFITGLNVGDLVEVIYNLPIAAGQVDASNISYDEGGIGAVESTVQKKLQEWVSVKDFGAKGDGSTDDTAAIQEALTQSANKCLYFPDGTYKISSTLTAPAFITILGASEYGSIINGAALSTNQAILSITGSQYNISNLKFVGSGTQLGISAYNGYFNTYTNLYFTNLKTGLALDESGACRIFNCNFASNTTGILCQGGSAYVIDQCNFDTATVTGVKSVKSPTTTFSTGISVVNCVSSAATGISCDADGTQTAYFNNCYFEGQAVVSVPFSIGQTGTGPIFRVTVSNCIIANTNDATSTFGNITNLDVANNVWGQAIVIQNTVTYLNQSGDWFLSPGYISSSAARQTTNINGALNTSVLTTNFFDNNLGGSYASLTNSSGAGVQIKADRFIPSLDNSLTLGDNVHRWTNVWAVNGTIQTSDANEKQQIADLTLAEQAVARELKGLVKTFKFNDAVVSKNENARIHCGVIAQDVAQAFINNNLNPDKYGVFCSDTWYEVDGKSENSEGIKYTELTPNSIKITKLGIRYEELFAFVIASL